MPHPVRPRTFPEQPDTLDLGHREKKLHSPYIYEWEQYGAQLRLVVPAGFTYNGASVPQIVWSIYTPHALDRAAVFHDFIYRMGGDLPAGSYQYRYDEEDDWKDFPGDTHWSRRAADTLFFK